MASLRFKKDGTPFVDLYAHGKRHRPEFTQIKDAKKFCVLASSDPIEAYDYWMESLNPKNLVKAPGFLSLNDKVQSFKSNYYAKRARGEEMKRVMDCFLKYILEKYSRDDIEIREIIFEDLEDYQTHLKKSGLTGRGSISNASVNRYFSTIKTFFKRQFMARVIPVDVSAFVETLPVDVVRREAWKDESTVKLIERLESEGCDRVLIEIVQSNEWAPFGPTDYSRLKWSQIDFKSGLIRAYRMKGKGKREWNLPILSGLESVLRSILKRQKAAGFGGTEDFVYMDKEWRPINPGWVSKNLERHRKALGIKEVPYSTRHRIITELAKRTDRDTASRFAGHASIKTTEKHYLVGGDDDFKDKIKGAFEE